MRIDELTVRNFRRFAEQPFRFHPNFNLVVGENGAGKSTVLDGVSIAIGSWMLGIRGYDSRSIEPDEIRVVRQQHGEVVTFERQFPVEVEADGFVLQQHVKWTRTLESADGRTTRVKAGEVKRLAEMAEMQVRTGQTVSLPLISHYGAGRLWVPAKDMKGGQDAGEPTQPSRLDGYRFSLDPRINFADLFRWLRQEKYVALQEGAERQHFTVVKKAILGCLEGGRWTDYDVKEETLLVEVEGRGILPYHLLSDGQRNMVALAADIGFKAAQLNPQHGDRVLQETSGVVLIDELDLHLHPRWQRHVVCDLKRTFPKIQFFASTHSPQVVGETPRDEVIVLREAGPTQPSVAYGADSNWLLEFEMGAQARNAQAADLIRLVEEALDEPHLAQARAKLNELRKLLGGDDGETVRLESTIHHLEDLARADD